MPNFNEYNVNIRSKYCTTVQDNINNLKITI